MPPQWVVQCEIGFIQEKKTGLEEGKVGPATVFSVCAELGYDKTQCSSFVCLGGSQQH